MRSPDTVARGPQSVSTELAGPESVPLGGGPGISGSIGPLTVGTTLRGFSGHLDPTDDEIPLVQSRVLSNSGDSGPGRVGVPAAAAVAAAVATVWDSAEREESTRNTVQMANSSTNRKLKTHTIPDLTNVLKVGFLIFAVIVV